MKTSTIIAAALLALGVQASDAADVVGYNVVTIPAESDVLVSAPFNQGVEATFTVSSVSGADIVVDEATTSDAYDSSYYIRIVSGDADGLWSTISETGENGFTVEDSDVLADVVAGDELEVIAHHTVSSLFSEGMTNVIWDADTEILLPFNDSESINKSSEVVSYSGDGVWTAGRDDYSDEIIEPTQGFIIRNGSANDYSWVSYGSAVQGAVAQILPAGDYDLTVAGLVVSTAVSDLGLEGEGLILLPFNTADGYNKSYEALTYDAESGLWESGRTDYSDYEIPAGEAFIIRRNSTDHTSDFAWTLNQ